MTSTLAIIGFLSGASALLRFSSWAEGRISSEMQPAAVRAPAKRPLRASSVRDFAPSAVDQRR